MPDWSQSVRERLAGLNLDPASEAAIVEELAGHLDARFRELLSHSMPKGDAARLVLDELESSSALATRLRRTRLPGPHHRPAFGAGRKGNLMESLWYDFRVALRLMLQKPAFSAAVIGMLALGIAGNVAIFSIFNGLLLRPLPFTESERLVDIDETAPKWNLVRVGISNPDSGVYLSHSTTFDGLAFYNLGGSNLTTDDGSVQRIKTASVTQGMMSVFRLKTVIGRDILPEEDRPNGANVILLGYDLWQRLYFGDRNAVGKIIKLTEKPYTVIGVLPREAMLPPDVEAWIPLQADVTKAGSHYLSGVGRLKPGVTQQQAQADLLRAHRTRQENTGPDAATSPTVGPLPDRFLGNFKTATRILMGAVALVLLIACVNIAGLMLVRGEGRSREIAIRLAVGAGRGRVFRQLITEGLSLALAGGLLGAALGKVLLAGLITLMPDDLPKWVRFNLDLSFVLFCAAVTGAAAVLFSMAPAFQAAAVDTRNRLADMTRFTLTRGKRTTLSVLVVGEVALALVLLAASGLVLQAFRNVMHEDPGFRADNVLTFSLRLAPARHPKESWLAFYNGLIEKLRALPSASAVSAASIVPMDGHSGYFYKAENGRKLTNKDVNPVGLTVIALPGYLEAMGLTLKSGRDFDDRDNQPNATKVVLVNETFAKFFFGSTDVVGKRAGWPADKMDWFQIIGVVKDNRHYGLDSEIRPEVFVSYHVNPTNGLSIAIRTRTDPHTLAEPARRAIRELDSNLPMFNIRTMSERLQRSLWIRRAYSWLFAAFAAVAMLLAAAGVYSVLSFAVSQRTREIGIRMALGARPGQVLRGVLAQGMLLVAFGIVVGLITSQFTGSLLKSILFGVGPRDVATYAAVVVTVVLVGLLANFVPARRAASIEPMTTLRTE